VNDLLELAVKGHGGLPRWEQISRFRASVSITGAIWAGVGRPGLLEGVVLDGETRRQRLTITPFPRPDRHATWEPDRQVIETAEGVLVAERRDPAAGFTGTDRRSSWDELQVACFASEATWNYLVAPFRLVCDDVVTEESWPWREDGQVWRTLLVSYPDRIVAQSREQTYYFDGAGLLRRLDYAVDVLGGDPAVQYPSRYRQFDGIMVPTRRRVYARNPDGDPIPNSVSVAIDVTDVTFT
jgi:hypothetical protein